jgi:hypothetical protein
VIAALGASQIVGYGTLYYAFPLLVPGMAAEFGVSQPWLFGVYSTGLLLGGLAAPPAGRLIDGRGAPRVMVAGSAMAGALLTGLALAPGPWLLAALVLALEVVAVAVLYDAAFASLARFAGTGARRAITRLTLIGGFASTLFWPLTDALAGALGWRGTWAAFVALHLTVGLGVHLWLLHRDRRRRPAALAGAPAPGPVPQPAAAAPAPLASRDAGAAFLAVASGFALSAVVISALGVHMVPVLAAAGLGAQATLVAMLMGPAQVGIRLVDALFWRRLHPLTVAAISALALPAAVAGLISGLPAWAAGAALAVLFGVGQGLSSIVRGSVPLMLFGAEGYGARLGRLALIRTLASAGAPVGFAVLTAGFGLDPALRVLAALGLVGALPILWLRARLGAGGQLAPLL